MTEDPIRVTRTLTFDGSTKGQYDKIVAHLETLKESFPGWQLIKEPLVNRVTAVKTEEVEQL